MVYLCLFTDINHCTYSYDVGPSDFSIPHRTIEEFLNGKHLENKNELFKYYLKPRNYHHEEFLSSLENIFESFNSDLKFSHAKTETWNQFVLRNDIKEIQDNKMLITLHENIFKILNSNDYFEFSSRWKSVILDNKETYYYCFLDEQHRDIGSAIDLECFNKDIPDIMQLKCDLIHPYPPYSDNLPVIFERSIQEKGYYNHTDINIRYFNLKQTEISSISVQFTSPDGLCLPISHFAKQSFVKLKFKKSMQFNLPISINSKNSTFEENIPGSFRNHMNPPLNFDKKHTKVAVTSFIYPNTIHMFPKNMSCYIELERIKDGDNNRVRENIPLPNLCGSEFIHKPEIFINALNKRCKDVIKKEILIWSLTNSPWEEEEEEGVNENAIKEILSVRCTEACVIRIPITLSHFLGLDFTLVGSRENSKYRESIEKVNGEKMYRILLSPPHSHTDETVDYYFDYFDFHFRPDFSFFYPDSLFICCSLICPVITGSGMRRLLKIIKPDTDPKKVHQKYFTYEFETHEYFPIENSHYSDFEIQIQYFNGDVMNFKNDGEVVRMGMNFIN